MTRHTFTREFYIPTNARKVAAKNANVVFYVYQTAKGDHACMCFVGRAQKPTWHYTFKDCAKRGKGTDRIAAKIEAQIATCQRRDEDSRARRAARNGAHKLEVGMILYTSWGYEQTNVDFFEVVEVPSKCFVKLVKIGAQRATDSGEFGHGMAEHVVPNTDARGTSTLRRKVNTGHGRDSVKISDVETAWVWDGKPVYCSWYA